MNTNSRIVKAALEAVTVNDAITVYSMIVSAIGADYRRPLFDTVDNYGAVTGGSGSYDHKAIEPVTNMHDTVLELAALRMYGSHAAVPFKSPLEASRTLFDSTSYAELASLQREHVRIRPTGKKVKTPDARVQG
jgi:hypothetical protein